MKLRLGWIAGVAGLLAVREAPARVESESGYTKAQTYNAALRYLRVDLGYEVTERDPDAAYLLFRYVSPGGGSSTNGSIEIVEAKRMVHFYVQLPQMPEYHEVVLSEGLGRKLRSEYGDPPADKPPEPPQREVPPKKGAAKAPDRPADP